MEQPVQTPPADPSAALRAAIEARFFAPLRRPRTRRVGVELEMPIWNLAPGAPNDFAEFAVLCRDLSPGNKLNLLAYDGEQLFAHANAAGLLHIREADGAALLSTRPLAAAGDGWQPLPLCTPLAWRGGVRAFAAPAHRAEYVAAPDDFHLFFTEYAAL